MALEERKSERNNLYNVLSYELALAPRFLILKALCNGL